MSFSENAVSVVRWLGNGPGQEGKYKVTLISGSLTSLALHCNSGGTQDRAVYFVLYYLRLKRDLKLLLWVLV